MSQVVSHDIPVFATVADLLKVTGDVPTERIRLQPAPGTATEEDVVRINESKAALCELVDGVLVEKTMGSYESYLAILLAQILGAHVRQHHLGILCGEAGMMRLMPGLVRAPDVSFISWERLREASFDFKKSAMSLVAPDLPIEILSLSNTHREMDRKLREYFTHGARQVWYLEPRRKEMTIYTSPENSTVVDEHGVVSGGDVLPGFEFPLAELFADDDAFRRAAEADE